MDKLKWLIGCSGFHYKEWKELFYPKGLAQTKWFEHYTKHFNTLEINNTFYRFPEVKTFANWYIKSPDQFIFSVKVPGTITHYKQFSGTGELVTNFYNIAREGLKEKLGPVLFQLPPRMAYSPERLQTIISQINSSYINVIEFRNISWWRQDVFQVLKEKNIIFCGVSYPGLINDAICTTPVAYYRFHGVPRLYHSLYENSFLDKIMNDLIIADIKTAYIYFNNTASAAALENARYIQKKIGHESPPQSAATLFPL